MEQIPAPHTNNQKTTIIFFSEFNSYYNPYPYPHVSDIGCDEKASHGLGSDDVVYLGTVGKDSKRHNNKIAADW